MDLNLLPSDRVDFGKEKYWDDFFSKIQSTPFEWYGEYDELCEYLDKYIRLQDKILVIGCGNSKLSFSLYNVGFCNITNVDISSTVISQMNDTYKTKCPLMIFEKADILEMPYEDESFNVLLDKGTLDAIMVDISSETIQKVNQMFSEISRVLKFGGRYICISLLQPHILLKALDWFFFSCFMIRIHRCSEAEKTHENAMFSFPVFMMVFTKMKKLPGSMAVLEMAMQPESQPKRMKSIKEIVEFVKSIQHFAMIKHHISKRKMTDNNLCLELSCTKTGKIKYRLYIVDLEESAPTEFGVFIVPQGRETEWLFSTPEGRLECAASAKCERVIFVHLLRDFHYDNLDEVKKDLSANVMELAPKTLRSQVPFLSIGDDLGTREVRKRGKSEISGDYIIEDSEGGDKHFYRRLVFLNNPYLVQSEVKLKKGPEVPSGDLLECRLENRLLHSARGRPNVENVDANYPQKLVGNEKFGKAALGYRIQTKSRFEDHNSRNVFKAHIKGDRAQNKKKSKKPKWMIDFDCLASDYHLVMIKGVAFLASRMAAPKVLQIGLGGGGLASYMYHHFPEAHVEVVELDPEIVEIAKEWFGLKVDKRLKVSIADGLDVIKEAHEKGVSFDAIMLDIDSKDSSLGISCPPQVFVSTPYLNMLSTLVGKDGILMINLACRNAVLKTDVYSTIKAVFSTVCYVNIPDEVNEVVYCINQPKSEQLLQELKSNFSKLCAFLKKQKDCSFDLNPDEVIKELKFVTE